MTQERKALIHRNLLFWLCGGKIDDAEKCLQQIALDTNSTRDEVWNVYCEMVDAALTR